MAEPVKLFGLFRRRPTAEEVERQELLDATREFNQHVFHLITICPGTRHYL